MSQIIRQLFLLKIIYKRLIFQRIIFFPKVLYIWGKRLGFINGIFPLGNMKSIKPNNPMPCFCRCFVEAVEKAKHWIYLRRVGGKNALGIVAKSPQHSEDLQRKARPER